MRVINDSKSDDSLKDSSYRYSRKDYATMWKIVLPVLKIIVAGLTASISYNHEKWEDPELENKELSDYEKGLLSIGLNPNGNYCDKEKTNWLD